MDIPAYFVTFRDRVMTVSDGNFRGSYPREGVNPQPLSIISETADRTNRSPVVIIDCNSFDEHTFSEKVMKNLTVKGHEIWFMTYIETVEDVFDAFNRDASYVLAPYHLTESDTELVDICDVSDSVMPVIFIKDGKAVTRNGRRTDVLRLMEKLVSFGFYKNVICDMDGTLDEYTWSVISEDYPSTFPLIPYNGMVSGFQHEIIPYRY